MWSIALLLLLGQTGAPPVAPVKDLEAHVRTLASDKFEGRMTLQPGLDLAADYITRELRKNGVRPFHGRSYFHEYDITIGQRPTGASRLQFRQGTTVSQYKLGEDFAPLIGSSSREIVNSRVVDVGPGNAAAYEGKNVRNAVVVVDVTSDATNGAKAQIARDQGAVGVIFLYPEITGKTLPRLNRAQGIRPSLDIVALGVRGSKFWQNLVPGGDNTARATWAQRLRVTMSAGLEPNKGRAKNIVGVVPGSDPQLRNEYVIIGAHYDHLGFGEVGSRTGANLIHNGADDNASGTAGVLALAKHYARTKTNKRTILFQFYSGEEVGLVGSNAWAKDHPEVLERTTLMINMDMIGRVRENKIYLYGLSTATRLESIVNTIAPGGANIEAAPNVRSDSDQASFARRNVPVLVFFSGLHQEYHTENDKVDTINFEGMSTILEMAAAAIGEVDRLPKLAFNPEAQLGNTAGDRAIPGDPSSAPGGAQRRIRVGFIPDMSGGEGEGLAITGVSPRSPAEKAGFKAGDRILEFNAIKVTSLETLNAAMGTVKPGDKVKIVYLREGKRMEAELTVEERTGG
ncbi:MAG TPA: M28 family peptidase [Fimbriimonadaceae bacterium]|nr:M28 family peptidase [Fimbriimonadaceae bacterium]